jgi:Peptidase A4 family
VKERLSVRALGLIAGSVLSVGFVVWTAGQANGAVRKPAKSDLAVYNANVTVGSVSAVVTLPSYTCKRADALVTYENTYDGANAGWSGAGVYLGCGKHRVPTMSAQLTVDGTTTYPEATLNAGDRVELSTTCDTPGTVVTLDDLTSGSSVEASSSSPSDCSGAFIGDIGVLKGAGSKLRPIPDFTTIGFSGVMVNAAPLGNWSPTATNYYEGKKNQITVGPIGGGGTMFVTTNP